MKGRVILLTLAVCLAAGQGCSIRKLALRGTGKVLMVGAAAMSEESDYESAKASFPASLKTIESLLAADLENPHFLFLLAQGYASFVYLFVEDELDLADAAGLSDRVVELKARAGRLYARAEGFAARLLHKELRAIFLKGGPEALRKAVAGFKKEHAPGLFWYAFSWVGQVNIDQSNPDMIAQLAGVETLLAKVRELDPGYFYGLPNLLSGAIFAGRPPMFGGDLPRGRKFFEAGIESSQGTFLLGPFLLARWYAVQAQDGELFCTTLRSVAAASQEILPEQRLMNTVSQRWAVRWLDRAADLFLDLEGGCAEPASTQETGMEGSDDLLE